MSVLTVGLTEADAADRAPNNTILSRRSTFSNRAVAVIMIVFSKAIGIWILKTIGPA